MIKALLLIVALGVAGCPSPDPPPSPNTYCHGTPAKTWFEQLMAALDKASTIIGGEPSTDRRATALVSIGGTGYCSGTVVGLRTVLTAAHCLGDDMSATIGAQTFQVAETLRHPDYTGRAPYNDLALLFFEQELPGPIIYKVYDSTIAADCEGLVAQGFGVSETPAIDLNESGYRVVQENTKTLYTKQIEEGGICFGDSGGPLYALVGAETQIAGVTSTTYSQDCMIGGDHVRLSFYIPWLTEHVR